MEFVDPVGLFLTIRKDPSERRTRSVFIISKSCLERASGPISSPVKVHFLFWKAKYYITRQESLK